VTSNNHNIETLKKDSQALVDEGKLEEAAAVLEKMVLILEKPESADRDELISVLGNLGACYFGMQDYDKTVSVYSRLVVNLDEKHGMDHIETIKAVYKLGKSCEKAGSREQAQTMYYIAKESAMKTLHDGHYLRQSINESYHSLARPKKVVEVAKSYVVGDLHDPEAITKAAKALPQTLMRLSANLVVMASVITTVVLIIASAAWFSSEFTQRRVRAERAQAASAFTATDKRPVSKRNIFSTTDQLLTLKFFNDNEGEFECDGKALKMDVVTLTDSFDSILKLIDPSIRGSRVWAELTKDGIEFDAGIRLFSTDSPPAKLAAACETVAKVLNEYYKSHGTYPETKSPIIAKGQLTYTNPLSGKPQTVNYQNFSQYMQIEHIFTGATTIDEAVKFLQAGGRWIDEPAFKPGDIHCVSRYSGEKLGENFIIPNAFLHVAGEDKELLPSSGPNEALVLALEKGDLVVDSYKRSKLSDLIVKTFNGKTLFFVKSQGVFTNAWLFKNLTTIILAFVFLFSLCWWFVFDARARLNDHHKPPCVSEIIVGLTALLFGVWIAFTMLIPH